jgi:hypothetical protein
MIKGIIEGNVFQLVHTSILQIIGSFSSFLNPSVLNHNIFYSRYISKSERYIFGEDNCVKDMIGPRLVTNLAIYWYNKINLNSVDPDLINEKYDYQIKHRINENIRNETFNI